MHVIAAKAVAFKEALSAEFKNYQKNIVKNAKALASHLIDEGIKLVSNGTDNHMMIVDLRNLNITGKDAEEVLGRAGITVNKNSIPFEKLSPMVTSGQSQLAQLRFLMKIIITRVPLVSSTT